MPYLPIDPHDVSRTYDADVIRINSQSGKGGIGYILETAYGYNMPPEMREHFGYTVKAVSDHNHAELKPDEVFRIFEQTYLNRQSPVVEFHEAHYMQGKQMRATVTVAVDGQEYEFFGSGNGRINAVNNALKQGLGLEYTLRIRKRPHQRRQQCPETGTGSGIYAGYLHRTRSGHKFQQPGGKLCGAILARWYDLLGRRDRHGRHCIQCQGTDLRHQQPAAAG